MSGRRSKHAHDTQQAELTAAAFTHAGPSPLCPAEAASSSVCKLPSASNTRTYRCSKCGKVGHNIRSCPIQSSRWYRQRCSICGQTGHNARNCSSRSRCRVCNGSGKLKCSKCDGGTKLHNRILAGKGKVERMSRGAVFFDAKQSDDVLVEKDGRIGGKSVTQVRMAKKAWGEKGADTESGDGEQHVCNRCLGTGFLTCMACTGDD